MDSLSKSFTESVGPKQLLIASIASLSFAGYLALKPLKREKANQEKQL